MAKLKLTEVPDDKPVRVTLDLPPALHRDLVRYGQLLGPPGGAAIEPVRLIAPMLAQFIGSDRAFRGARRRSD